VISFKTAREVARIKVGDHPQRMRTGTVQARLLRPSGKRAGAARAKRCDGIGNTITKLRAKGVACDPARTLAARWAETAASGRGGRVVRIEGFRCVRRNPPGPGVAVRCGKRGGALLVTFRFRRP
jgi:hypothetical protein